MTSIVNLFSNFNDLTKPKSVTDNVTDYKANANSCNEPSPSLSQGKKFKKYQGKIANNLEKRIKKSDLVEGFKDLDLNKNGLTEQTNNLLDKNDFTSQQQTLSNLKNDYQTTLNEYQTLTNKISGNTSDYIGRVSPNNPYLNKVIQLQGGALFYVTKQGVAKNIPSMDVYTAVSGKNGFPRQGQFVTVAIPFDNSYSIPGATIPTKPPLVTGTPVEVGEGVGNEGVNVFVNSVVKNPQSSYINCYNNVPPSTQIMFVPKMNASNSVNGYNTYASSVYNNDNNFTGPWNAFDQNVNTWWHSGVSSSSNLYNANSGQYTGTTQVPFTNSSGVQTSVKGEFLQINLPGVGTSNSTSIPLTKYEIQGRQGCCGNPNGRDPNTWYILGWTPSGGWQQVDYQSNISFNYKMLSFNVSNPKPCSAYLIIITVAGDSKAPAGNRSCVQIGTWNLYTSSNSVNNPTPAMTNVGQMNFEQCQSYAVNSGNKYFGIQSVDNTGVGNCMTSNDLAGSQINGIAINYRQVPIWDSKTYGNNPGSTMSFNNGSISVLNSSGASVFSTPNNSKQPSTYIGCYGDSSKRAMTAYNGGRQQYNNATCQQAAQSQGAAYYGLQNSTSGQNAQCFTSNSLSQTQKYGVAKNCTKISDGSWSGGGWSNSVYSTSTPTLNYFLILQDDGNMCIYLGSSPSDNQGFIWQSKTNGKQKTPNPNFTAAKGKFGKNWIPSGSTLSPGDFIGSTNGSMYLIMQSDGNLVLYTSTASSKCSSSRGKTVGAQDVNALYQIVAMGNKASIGKLAYIDQNSERHSYPSNNINFSNSYTNYSGIDSGGNDIPSAAYGNATVEKCQSTCNSNPQCAGFAFSNNVCYPKTSNMFPNGAQQVNKNVNLYTRNKAPINPPIGVPGTVVNIDTITYDSYKNGGDIDKSYGLANATSSQKQQLEQLQSKLNMLTSQINGYTNKFSSGTDSLNSQSSKNMEGLGDYLKDFEKTNTNIKSFNTNIENILNDSDITVLQKNYDYLFWSILAAGTVLVTMNITKKQ
jgi:hypothetical protein